MYGNGNICQFLNCIFTLNSVLISTEIFYWQGYWWWCGQVGHYCFWSGWVSNPSCSNSTCQCKRLHQGYNFCRTFVRSPRYIFCLQEERVVQGCLLSLFTDFQGTAAQGLWVWWNLSWSQDVSLINYWFLVLSFFLFNTCIKDTSCFLVK